MRIALGVCYSIHSLRDEPDLYRALRQIGTFTTIPMILAAGPLVGFFLGRFLDARLRSAPWGLIGGLVVGFLVSVRETIRMIRRAMREPNDGA